jgi:hypothetical protein
MGEEDTRTAAQKRPLFSRGCPLLHYSLIIVEAAPITTR